MAKKISLLLLLLCLSINLFSANFKLKIPPIDADPSIIRIILQSIALEIKYASIQKALAKRISKSSEIIGNKRMGCILTKKQITFYMKTKPDKEVYVCGSFNYWFNKHPKWKLTDKKNNGLYKLTVPLSVIKTKGIHFIFIINNRYVYKD